MRFDSEILKFKYLCGWRWNSKSCWIEFNIK
jgi:hypothetical protein